jgi:hypothetical protein
MQDLLDFGHVYVVEFDGVCIKIGKSKQPAKRIKALSLQAGRKITRQWFSPLLRSHNAVEKEAHGEMGSKRNIGEYFSVDFDHAVRIVSGLCTEVVCEEEKEEALNKTEAYLESDAYITESCGEIARLFHVPEDLAAAVLKGRLANNAERRRTTQTRAITHDTQPQEEAK